MSSQSIIERETELNILQSAIDNITARYPLYFFISGSSGIGKSTLVENIKIPKAINKITTSVFDLGLPEYSVLNNSQSRIVFEVKPKTGKGRMILHPGRNGTLYLKENISTNQLLY